MVLSAKSLFRLAAMNRWISRVVTAVIGLVPK